jgi:hypothetical protein
LDSCDFYTMNPFGDCNKKLNIFRFGHDFEFFASENSNLAHAQQSSCAHNLFRWARLNITIAYGCFWAHLYSKFPKRSLKLFTLWVFFVLFKKIRKCWAWACS